MPEIDEILEQKLEELEDGAPLESVLSGLPEDADELGDMIRLAAVLQRLQQPQPSPELARARQFRITASARASSQVRRTGKGTLRWIVTSGVFRIVSVVAAVVLLASAGIWIAGPSGARAATLMDVNGGVQVASSPATGDWRPAINGERLHAGQALRTQSASGATLVFFDGSRSALGPDTQITLDRLGGRWGGVLQAQFTQAFGRTSQSIVPLRGEESFFQVLTPSGAASVRGTQFDVLVAADGRARFSVEGGEVLVTNAASHEALTAGQATVASPATALEAPAYQFTLQGELTDRNGQNWTAAGVAFIATPATLIGDGVQVGQEVQIEGRILKGRGWVADSITLASGTNLSSSFTGRLVSTGSDVWEIGNEVVRVDAQTRLGQGLQAGQAVRVTFAVLGDLYWQALAIEPLAGAAAGDLEKNTPIAHPELAFTPDAIQAGVCGPSADIDATLANAAVKAKDAATGVKLTAVVTDGMAYVEKVELVPDSIERIDPGQNAGLIIRVTLAPAWETAGPEEAIRLQVTAASDGAKAGEEARLAVVLHSSCTVTPSPSDEPTVEGTPGAEALCVGASPQPTGVTLSERYDVTYEEIMGWFCQGYGFGEIDLAYSILQEYRLAHPGTTLTAEDLFELRSQGLGWGQIKDELLPKATKEPKENLNKPPTNTPKPTKEPNVNPNQPPTKTAKPNTSSKP